jgi:hypothetical protein
MDRIISGRSCRVWRKIFWWNGMREQLLGATIGAAPPQGEANATNIIAEEV